MSTIEDQIRLIVREEFDKLLGRSGLEKVNAIHKIGECELNMRTFCLTKNGLSVKIEPAKLKMLAYLANNKGTVCSQEELYYAAHEEPMMPGNRSVVDAIAKLRRIIEPIRGEIHLLITVPTVGYRLCATPEVAPALYSKIKKGKTK